LSAIANNQPVSIAKSILGPLGTLMAILMLDLFADQRPLSLPVAGLIDELAHVGTTLLALSVLRPPVTRPFAVAALAAGVLIDVDHLPHVLGHFVVGREVSRDGQWLLHSVPTVAIGLALAWCLTGDRRRVGLGVAFGVAIHLIRDLATGGTPFFWPVVDHRLIVPYEIYAILLLSLLGIAWWRGTIWRNPHAAS
jgi:inner membrane protein